MARSHIIIGESDMNVLKDLVSPHGEPSWRHDPNVRELAQEIARAKVVPDDKVPADVVRLGCEVRIHEPESKTRPITYRIVLPHEARFEEDKISVVSPIGTGLLGYRVGDSVTWPVPGGKRTWMIDRVQAPSIGAIKRKEEAA